MIGVILDADSLGQEIDLNPVTSLLDDWQVFNHTLPEDTATRIKDASIVLSNKVLLNQAVLEQAAQLKFISVMATGTNNVDLRFAASKGITVSNALAYATPSVVQHTLSLILALATNLPRYLEDVRTGKWHASRVFCLLDHPITEIAGKSLGIVGYGELGTNLARAAGGLGMQILISARPGETASGERIAFRDLLQTADYVSLHCPLTPENEHLLNAETLALMKPGAFLINTARGGLVDSTALLDALDRGIIAGAAVDVLAREPADADEPLVTPRSTQGKNLLVTPHNAWGAIESRQRLVTQMRENIEGFIAGAAPRQVTD